MKVRHKIARAIGKFAFSLGGANTGGYEAAKQSRTRSNIDLVVQNAKKDLSRFTVDEIRRKARYLHRNSPVVRGLVERLTVLTIGTGLYPSPATSDEAFNEAAKAAWKGWAKRPDIESKSSFNSIQKILFRSLLVDGDSFALHTFGSSGRARIQLIEAQDICSTIGDAEAIDGVKVNFQNRPTAFVWRKEEDLPAEIVSQFYIHERIGQKRGLSALHAIINTGHDIDDILALEKVAVKDASSKTDIVKTADGELPSADYIGRTVREADSENSVEELTRYYREIIGPETKVMRAGDEFDPYVSGRPSPSWQGFIQFLADLIALGTGGFPPSILLGQKVGGADTRRDIALAQKIIESWQDDFSGILQEIYEYVIEDDINRGYLKNPPKDWREAEWQTPSTLTADAGREADSDREDIKLGVLTRRELFGRFGMDWKEQTIQAAEEAAFISKLAKKLGIERGEISLLDPNELSQKEEKTNVEKE